MAQNDCGEHRYQDKLSDAVARNCQADGKAPPFFEPVGHQGGYDGDGSATESDGCQQAVADIKLPEGIDESDADITGRDEKG